MKMKTVHPYYFIIIIPMGAWSFLFYKKMRNKGEKNTKPHRINISIMAELGGD